MLQKKKLGFIIENYWDERKWTIYAVNISDSLHDPGATLGLPKAREFTKAEIIHSVEDLQLA